MKRILALLLVLVMALSLAACAAKTETADAQPAQTETAPETEAAPEEQPAAEATAETAHDPVTIRVASYRSEDEAIYNEIIARFQAAYPYITVELELNPDQNSYDQNLQADVMNNTAPDVFDMHTSTTYMNYAADGVLLPLDELSFNANYQDGAKAISSVGGINYGFLNAYNMISILYNKAIFEAEGLSVPETFDDFVALCKTLREKGYGGVAYPGGTVSNNWLTKALLVIADGADGYKDLMEGMDTGKYTNPEDVAGTKEALQTAQAFRDNNILYDASEATDLDQCMSLFAQGMAPMMINGTWVFATKDKDFPDIDAGVFAIPTMANNGAHYAEGAQVTVISAASEHAEAAKLWVDFLASQEISSFYCSSAKMISTIEGVGLDYDGGDILAEAAANGVNILPTLVRNNGDYWYGEWKNVLYELVYGTQTYDEVLTSYIGLLEDVNLAALS